MDLVKEFIAIGFVGDGDVFLKIMQTDGFDHSVLDLGHNIPDVSSSFLCHRCELAVQPRS